MAHTTQFQKTKKTQLKKWAEDSNRCFSKKDTDGQQAHEKMFNITKHQRNANQTTMRYYLTPVRKAIIKTSTNNKCWGGSGEKGMLAHC